MLVWSAIYSGTKVSEQAPEQTPQNKMAAIVGGQCMEVLCSCTEERAFHEIESGRKIGETLKPSYYKWDIFSVLIEGSWGYFSDQQVMDDNVAPTLTNVRDAKGEVIVFSAVEPQPSKNGSILYFNRKSRRW